MIKIEIHDETFTIAVAGLEERLGPGMRKVIARYCMRIEAEAKRKAPVDVNRLRSSITSRVTRKGDVTEGRVGTNVDYAKFVHGRREGGTWVGPERHFVPFSVAPGLKLWLKRKAGMDPARLDKMQGITVGGKPPNPFLLPLLDKYKPDILEGIRKALEVE